jgi:HEAT repeat protein
MQPAGRTQLISLPLTDAAADPFLAASSAKTLPAEILSTETLSAEAGKNTAASFFAADNVAADAASGNNVTEKPETLPETSDIPLDIPLESEEQHTITEAEQVEILNQDIWVKNLSLLRFQETGRKPATVSSENRQRRDAMNRLNMSNKELAKKKNLRYEYITDTASDWRWMHSGVDKLLAVNSTLRTGPDVFLRETKYKDKKYRILRANAAVLLGRDGNTAVKRYLLQLVETESLPIKLRCAAAETLGRLPNVTETDLLPLLQHSGKSESAGSSQPQPVEVWEEILAALAEKINPWDNAVFTEPFTATPFDIRFAAARIWRIKSVQRTKVNPDERLPEAFINYAERESNPQIRIELIKTLGAWREPKLYQLVSGDLNRSADVRNAAMTALAENDCQEAAVLIKNKLHDPIGSNRAAAAEALRKLGFIDDVLKLAKDEDPRVRCEAAKALAEKCNPQTIITAKRYIEDRYEDVQSVTLESVTVWNIEESGYILLAALKSPFSKIRHRAAALLATHGVQYEAFDPADTPKNQAANYQELELIFRDTVGVCEDFSAPKNKEQETERRNFPPVSSVSSRSAQLAPLLAQLEGGTVLEQRKAAAALVKECSVEPLQNGDTKRILDIIVKQNDPAVLTTLLSTLKEADPVLVSPAARNMLQAEQPEIRRLSCEILKRFGTEDDLPLLAAALHDTSKAVVRGALQAVDTLLPKAQSSSVKTDVTETLKKMLYQSDAMLQMDIAATLHRAGSREGTEAIRRLAVSKDNRTKCYAAKTIAGLRDETFLPILLGYLDESNGSVRSEALQALPVLTGRDVANDAGSHTAEVSQTQRQISLWKTWAASRRQ